MHFLEKITGAYQHGKLLDDKQTLCFDLSGTNSVEKVTQMTKKLLSLHPAH